MPFTLAHPAIIFPFAKQRFNLSTTALIIGSIVPDFEFFIQLREVENIGHKWQGIILLDLPLSLILCFLYDVVLKTPLISNLPAYFQKRFTIFLKFNWFNYALSNKISVFTSLIIGICSHLFWDAFTHADGFFVTILPNLNYNIQIFGFEIQVFYLLQIVFSILGSVVVIMAIQNLPLTNSDTDTKIQLSYWITFLCFFISIFCIRVVGWPAQNGFWSLVMAFIGSVFYAWISTTLTYKIFSN